MNATVSPTMELTPHQAAAELLKIERRTESLLQRTVGLTWMIWAMVNAGIFVGYETVGFAAPTGAAATLAYGFVWLPWVILGALATTVLWRSLAIAIPSNLSGTRWVAPAVTIAFLVLVLGGLAVVALTRLPVDPLAWAMFAVGIAAAVVGGSGLTTVDRSERIPWLVGGIGVALLAVAVPYFGVSFGYDPETVLLFVAPFASTGLLFGGGLCTASR